jgi:hypothetical protein
VFIAYLESSFFHSKQEHINLSNYVSLSRIMNFKTLTMQLFKQRPSLYTNPFCVIFDENIIPCAFIFILHLASILCTIFGYFPQFIFRNSLILKADSLFYTYLVLEEKDYFPQPADFAHRLL